MVLSAGQIVGLVVLIFGVALVGIGIALTAAARHSENQQAELDQRCNASAEAELVGTVSRTSGFSDDNSITYYGTYSFVTQDGVRVQAHNEIGYGSPEDVPGPFVTIRYNPDNLAQFIIPQEQESTATVAPALKKAGVITLVLGVPLTVAGVVILVV